MSLVTIHILGLVSFLTKRKIFLNFHQTMPLKSPKDRSDIDGGKNIQYSFWSVNMLPIEKPIQKV